MVSMLNHRCLFIWQTCNIQACSLEWGTRKREGRIEKKLQYKWRSGNYTPKFWGLSNGTAAAAAAKSHQSCLILCDPIDGIPPGCPVPGILQARTPEWVAISLSSAWKCKGRVKSLSPTLRDPTDCSPPGSSVQGIFQARVLEWGAIAFSRYIHIQVAILITNSENIKNMAK